MSGPALEELEAERRSVAERPATGRRESPPAVAPHAAARAPRHRRGWLMRRVLLLADVSGLILAFAATELVAGGDGALGRLSIAEEALVLTLWLPLWIVGAKLFGLYDRDEERANHSTADELVSVFLLATVGAFLLSRLGALGGWAGTEDAELTLFWALGVGSVTAARAIGRTIARRSTAYMQNTVIVGTGAVGRLLARKLLQHPEYGLNLVGFVGGDSRRHHVDHVSVLGALEELPDIVEVLDVDRVVFAFSLDSHREHLHVVRRLRERGVQIDIVPRLFEVIGPKVGIHTIEGLALVGLPPVKPSRSTRMLKRALDIAGAAALLVIFAPVFAVAALLIKRSSPGPVLFRQTRLGQGRREFSFLKFRTMTVDADDGRHREYIETLMRSDAAPGPNGLFKLDREDAVTRPGRWLRRTSLDELPQLINVLRGDMSLVGPRPCLPYEVEHFAPHHFERFLVPAGMTGLWQVSARAHSTFVEALDMDVLYVQSASLPLDLRLLARTPLQLLRSSSTA